MYCCLEVGKLWVFFVCIAVEYGYVVKNVIVAVSSLEFCG